LMLAALVRALNRGQCPKPETIFAIVYLEGKMFEKMGCAIRSVCLCSTTGIDPYTNGRRLSPWRMLSRNLRGPSVIKLI